MGTYRIRSIGLAVLLAGAAAALIALYLASYRNHVDTGAKLVKVYVAARDVPEGTQGTKVSLRAERVPRRNVVAGAITKPKEISKQITGQPILSGEQVTTRQFRPLAQAGVLGHLRGTQRAMQIAGDANQLLVGTLEVGNHVDFVAAKKYNVRRIDLGNSGTLAMEASRVVIHNLEVLQAPEPVDSGPGSGGDYKVMLKLTDSQSQRVLFGLKFSDQWWLTLRPVVKPANSRESIETTQTFLLHGLRPKATLDAIGGTGRLSSNGG